MVGPVPPDPPPLEGDVPRQRCWHQVVLRATTVERSRPQARPQGAVKVNATDVHGGVDTVHGLANQLGRQIINPLLLLMCNPGRLLALHQGGGIVVVEQDGPLFERHGKALETVLHGPPSRWFHPGELSEVMVRNEQVTLRAPPSPERHQRCYARC